MPQTTVVSDDVDLLIRYDDAIAEADRVRGLWLSGKLGTHKVAGESRAPAEYTDAVRACDILLQELTRRRLPQEFAAAELAITKASKKSQATYAAYAGGRVDINTYIKASEAVTDAFAAADAVKQKALAEVRAEVTP